MAATAEALPLEGVTAKARRILVVDDDVDFADSIVEFLEARDYSVQVANDDRWAQAVAEDFAPEIALIDIRLGRASGVDLVSALKGRRPELICVMVTAHAEVDEAVKALRAGADDFLTKPLDPAMLFATLERGFAKHALILEKLAAEAALRDSELRFRSVAQSATDAMISVDGAGNIVFWNLAAENIFGYQEDEVLGGPLTLLMPARYREAHESGIARLKAGGESRIIGTTVELHGLKRDGTEFPVELSLAAWTSDEHTCFTGILRDITERKRAEEALRKAHDSLEIKVVERTRELRESEQRFRDISEASSDWFWEMDENLRFSYLSDHFTDVTGVAPEMLLGKTREETSIPDVDPDEWETHLANLAAHRSFRDFRHPRSHADGRVVHLSINGKAVFDEDGNFLGYCGTGSDITDRKLAEEALRESEARYREIFEESLVGILVEDWSAAKRHVDGLLASKGTTDLRALFDRDPKAFGKVYDLIQITHVSRSLLNLYGAPDFDSINSMYQTKAAPREDIEGVREAMLAFATGETSYVFEADEIKFDGTPITTLNRIALPAGNRDGW